MPRSTPGCSSPRSWAAPGIRPSKRLSKSRAKFSELPALPGNLAQSDLAAVAGADARNLQHVALDEPEAQAWADAAGQYARLNQVSGRCKCEGIGTINPGDVVTLAGVGKRFNGTVFVTGVRHEFDTAAGWKTHVQFGGVDDCPHDDSPPPAAGLVAGPRGLQIGVVVSNEDPDHEHRVRVRLPMIDEEDDGVWMRVACLDAGADRGFFVRPEIGDEVVVGFLEDDPRRGVILGMLNSSAKAAPLQGSDDNHEKGVQDAVGDVKLYFNDDKKIARVGRRRRATASPSPRPRSRSSWPTRTATRSA